MLRTVLLTVFCSLACTSDGIAQSTPIAFSKSVTRLDAGTAIGQASAVRWNRTVMLAKPRIASGDITALPESIREAAAYFVLSIVATVDLDPQAPQSRYRLAEVGVGYSVPVQSQLKVIHSDDYKTHGVSLSFIQRKMLAENEKQFDNIRTIARGNALLMFDVPAILHENNSHRDYTVRHLVWIDSNSGKLATMLWLVGTDSKNQPSVVTGEPIRWVDPTSVEDRVIHVDGNEFTLGIPSKRAFALLQPPAGRLIPWNQQAATVAALQEYDLNSMQTLMRSLNDANIASMQN